MPDTQTLEPTTEQAVPAVPEAFASLDAEIAHYTAIANAERESTDGATLEADDGQASEELPTGATLNAEPAEDEQVSDDAPAADGDPERPADGTEQRFSRRDAPRLQRELAETKQEMERHRNALTALEQQDRAVLTELAEHCGTETAFAEARDKAAAGDSDAQKRYAEMKEWRTLLGPVDRRYRAGMAATFAAMQKFDGMTDQDFTVLREAANPVDALKRAYEVGRRAGETKARSLLSTEASNLRTKALSRGPQPSVPGGAPKAPTRVAEMVDPATGALTDEAERLIRSGAFSGVALS